MLAMNGSSNYKFPTLGSRPPLQVGDMVPLNPPYGTGLRPATEEDVRRDRERRTLEGDSLRLTLPRDPFPGTCPSFPPCFPFPRREPSLGERIINAVKHVLRRLVQ